MIRVEPSCCDEAKDSKAQFTIQLGCGLAGKFSIKSSNDIGDRTKYQESISKPLEGGLAPIVDRNRDANIENCAIDDRQNPCTARRLALPGRRSIDSLFLRYSISPAGHRPALFSYSDNRGGSSEYGRQSSYRSRDPNDVCWFLHFGAHPAYLPTQFYWTHRPSGCGVRVSFDWMYPETRTQNLAAVRLRVKPTVIPAAIELTLLAIEDL